LKDDQRETARSWLDAVSAALKGDQSDDITVHKRGLKHPILVLTEDRRIEWQEDGLWERLMRLENAFKL
jgi:transposase